MKKIPKLVTSLWTAPYKLQLEPKGDDVQLDMHIAVLYLYICSCIHIRNVKSGDVARSLRLGCCTYIHRFLFTPDYTNTTKRGNHFLCRPLGLIGKDGSIVMDDHDKRSLSFLRYFFNLLLLSIQKSVKRYN